MTVTSLLVLADNKAVDDRLGFEHGWSVWIDCAADGCFLWDTGQTGVFLDNARILGVDPTTVRAVALSHGHHDHAGGLPTLLNAGYRGPVIGHPDILLRRYSRRGETTFRSIGMGDGRLADGIPGFLPVQDTVELAEGLTFVTSITRRPGSFTATDNLFRDTAGHVPDDIPDDAFLVIDAPDGPMVLLGCCHAGLPNTLAHAGARLGLSRIHTVAGGLHLGGAPREALAETVQSLSDWGVRRLLPGHCTGPAGLDFLREHFSGELLESGCGLCIQP